MLALENVNISIYKGDRVALVGHNGAGKSTLLRLIAGIYHPQKGSVTIRGKIASILNLNAGMVANLSGLKNIKLRCDLLGLDSCEEVYEDIKEFSELGDYLELPIRQYSAGMRMRLAFAMATAVKPDILLMDEWINAGDEKFREKTKERMEKFVDSSSTLVLASHNRNIVKNTCSRIIRIEHGIVVKDGPIGEFPFFNDYPQEAS